MRKIKFRAIAINTGEFVESMTISNGKIKRKKDNLFFEISENKWVGVITKTFGQYTEFKDINEIDICEGDICELSTGDIVLIKFEKGCFFIETEDKIIDYHLYIPFERNITIKIIGNIYKNPDLFK